MCSLVKKFSEMQVQRVSDFYQNKLIDYCPFQSYMLTQHGPFSACRNIFKAKYNISIYLAVWTWENMLIGGGYYGLGQNMAGYEIGTLLLGTF